ncbi:transketolase [Paenisporosarcina antarctica]|uniref:Transketolase n=1 Tax=Paenisporosarcina antarctica TaxID=417367 RepID=A0A4P7A2I8_9BACL|nr:transketolase [Paenisporosarcina antarctica]QBP42649.1 transketolase [Paenisporosarcina antarctica]
MEEITFLKRKAVEIRMDLLTMIYEARTGHTGGSLSSTDILTVLYYKVMNIDPSKPKWADRDRYVQSKGHSVEALWSILADKGFFPKEELKTFSQFGSRLIGHPNNKVPGIEMNTGALGHGLPISVGMALAAKLDGKSYKVYTLMGDGEQAEGSIWEGAMAAAQYKLDNLIAIIDRNRLQITGSTEDVMGLEPLGDKWRSFGWEVVEVDGNDIEQLVEVFSTTPRVAGKPTMIVANTVKGKGISFSENQVAWHHKVPTEEQFNLAIDELSKQLEVLV